MSNSTKEGYLRLIDEIHGCIHKSKRKDEVKLLCASKTFSADMIKEVYDLGHRDFGENYIKEALSKIGELPKDINWHFIGHIQSNKIKFIKDNFTLIHSIDSISKARAISERTKFQSLLIEVNIGKEASKNGIVRDDLFTFMGEINKIKNIRIDGLMVMPPIFDDPEKTRPFFRETRKLLEELKRSDLIAGSTLSMGTSMDFPIAIEEGATIIRVGTRIFGERK